MVGRIGWSGSLCLLMEEREGRRGWWAASWPPRNDDGILVATSGLPGPSNGFLAPMKPREAKGPPGEGGRAPMGPPGPRPRPGGGP